MNPLWSLLFKARFRNPFSSYRMSFAEVLVLFSICASIAYGITKGVVWLAGLEGVPL